MALTKIFTGMAQGPEAIDANFNTLDGSSTKIITDWSSDGISYKNGCTPNADTPNRIQYRIVKLGDSKFLSIVGLFNTPDLDFNQTIVPFTLPANVVSQFNKYGLHLGQEHNSWGDLLVTYLLNVQTGDFSVHNQNSRGDGKSGAGGLSVNYGVLA